MAHQVRKTNRKNSNNDGHYIHLHVILKNLTILKKKVKYRGKQKEGVKEKMGENSPVKINKKKGGEFFHLKNPGIKKDLIRAWGWAHSREPFSPQNDLFRGMIKHTMSNDRTLTFHPSWSQHHA